MIRDLVKILGFVPKDNTVGIYEKKYQQHNYSIEVDFSKEQICYGHLIGADCKTTQNFSQSENWVVLECVDRLLEKGYKPQNIILEKTWAAGHGTSGRLDICVTRDDGSEYLLIECKTFGKEFDKAVARMYKDGGQLFTYFKFSNKADIIMLYASELQDDNVVYSQFIISRFGMSPKCVRFVNDKFYLNDSGFTVQVKDNKTLLQKYIDNYLYINQNYIYLCGRGVGQKNIDIEAFNAIKYPLPPLEIQQKIVGEIEEVDKNNTLLQDKQVNLKNQIKEIINNCYKHYDKENLKKIVETNPSKAEIKDLDANETVSFIDMPSVSNNGYIENEVIKTYQDVRKGSYTYFKKGDVIIAKITPCMENGKCACANNIKCDIAFGSSEFHVFRVSEKIINKYLFTVLNRSEIRENAEKQMTGASGHRRVPIAFYENLSIPVPPLSEQQKIVAQIEDLEKQIAEAQAIIDNSKQQKQEILDKYLK